MWKKNYKLIIPIIIFFIGLILFMNSVKLGHSEADKILKQNIGMSTNMYGIFIQQAIVKYRIIGIQVVICGIGLLLYLLLHTKR